MTDFIKKYIKISYIICIPIAIVMLFFKDWKALILSLIFATTIRNLLFLASAYELNKILEKNPKRAKTSGFLGYFKRYVFYGLTIAVSAKNPHLNIYGAAIGLITLSLAINISNYIETNKNIKTVNKSNKIADELKE